MKLNVQCEHLPSVVRDNPQPHIEDKVNERTEGRYQILLILSRILVGCEEEELVRWVEEFLTPIKYQQQMRYLSKRIRKVDPGHFQVSPITSPIASVIIRWIYQELLTEHLGPAQRLENINFRHTFMSS